MNSSTHAISQNHLSVLVEKGMCAIPPYEPPDIPSTALVPIRKLIFCPPPTSTSDSRAIDRDNSNPASEQHTQPFQLNMSQFRSKTLDLAGFINARVVRDHTKRKVFEKHEPERYAIAHTLVGLKEEFG